MENELSESTIRAAWLAGDFQATAQLTLQLYGAEVRSFLVARLRDPDAGQEAFAIFQEDFWSTLQDFRFLCSARSWAYTLARNAANRYASAQRRQQQRHLPLSQHGSSPNFVAPTPSTAQVACRTDVKRQVRALREKLSANDQTLLILHVDRSLSWRELAEVMNGGASDLTPETLEREAARLRKRFERVKARLRDMAIQEGLLYADSRLRPR